MVTIGSYVRGHRQEIDGEDKRPRTTNSSRKDLIPYNADNVNRIPGAPSYLDNLNRCLHMSMEAKIQRAQIARAKTQTIGSFEAKF